MLKLIDILYKDNDYLFQISKTPKNPDLKQQYLQAIAIAINLNLMDNLDKEIIIKRKEDLIRILSNTKDLKEFVRQFYSKDEKNEIISNIIRDLTVFYGDVSSSNNLPDSAISIIGQDSNLNYISDIDSFEKTGLSEIGSFDGFESFNSQIVNKFLIKDYEVVQKMGSGTYGNVYLTKKSKDQLYVVKEIKKKKNINYLDEYVNLERLVDRCSEYFICLVEYIETDIYFYIVMNYDVGYVSLQDYLNKNNNEVSGQFIVNIINKLCLAINYMHSRGISHNDIKPDNLLVNQHGDIKIIDFGISCMLEKCKLSVLKQLTGTTQYMDPFQYNRLYEGNPVEANERKFADYFAFGILIYRLLLKGTPLELLYKKDYVSYFKNYDYSYDKNRDVIAAKMKNLGLNFDLNILLAKNIANRKSPCL